MAGELLKCGQLQLDVLGVKTHARSQTLGTEWISTHMLNLSHCSC